MHLLDQPFNTHQLSKVLDLDYKAVQHHMKVLQKNNMVSKTGEKYGAIFHLSNFLEIKSILRVVVLFAFLLSFMLSYN
jgi:predicted transcriptional regulator